MRSLYHSNYSRTCYRIWSFLLLCVDWYATLELGDADDLGERAGNDLLADVGIIRVMFYSI